MVGLKYAGFDKNHHVNVLFFGGLKYGGFFQKPPNLVHHKYVKLRYVVFVIVWRITEFYLTEICIFKNVYNNLFNVLVYLIRFRLYFKHIIAVLLSLKKVI